MMKIHLRSVFIITVTIVLLIPSFFISPAGAGWFDDLKDWAEETWDEAEDWAEETWDEAEDWAEETYDEAEDWAEETYDEAEDWAEETYDEAEDWAEETWDEAEDWAEETWDEAEDWAEETWDEAEDWAEEEFAESNERVQEMGEEYEEWWDEEAETLLMNAYIIAERDGLALPDAEQTLENLESFVVKMELVTSNEELMSIKAEQGYLKPSDYVIPKRDAANDILRSFVRQSYNKAYEKGYITIDEETFEKSPYYMDPIGLIIDAAVYTYVGGPAMGVASLCYVYSSKQEKWIYLGKYVGAAEGYDLKSDITQNTDIYVYQDYEKISLKEEPVRCAQLMAGKDSPIIFQTGTSDLSIPFIFNPKTDQVTIAPMI